MAADTGERTNQTENDQFVAVKSSLASELGDWKKKYSA
jgi:hypothetical protein